MAGGPSPARSAGPTPGTAVRGGAGATPRDTPAAPLVVVGAGVVVGVLLVVMASSFAALVFSGPLGVHLQKGIGLNLLGAVVALTVAGLLTSLPGAIAGPQDVTGVIVGVAAASIATRLPAADQATFLTVVGLMGSTSLLTGASFLALGTFRVADLIRYVPHPVVGGFLAGTGWLMVKGGTGIVTGVALSPSTLSSFADADVARKAALTLGFAAGLLLLVRRLRHSLLVPASLALLVVAFYGAVLASGSTIDEAEAGGWLLGPFPEGGLWRPWALDAVGGADWAAVASQAPTVVSAVVVAVLGLLLNASGLELATDRDLDLNRELRAAGTANLLVGASGTMPGYQMLGATLLSDAMGALSRLTAVVAAGVCAAALGFGASVLSLLPRLALGGLVAFLGLSLLVEWLYDARLRLRTAEYLLVVAILLVVAAAGFLAGVAAGVAAAVALFVVEASRVEVVQHEFTLRTFHSHVDRTPDERAVLEDQGDATSILKLHGFLFFGTANRLLHRVRDRVADPDRPPLEALVLDFARVTGTDSSAVISFTKIARLGRSAGFHLLLTRVSPPLRRLLSRAGLGPGGGVQVLDGLDDAVQWCEDRLLRAGHDAPEASPLAALLAALPPACLEKRVLPAGQVLLQAGDPSDDLFFLADGRLTTLTETAEGGSARVRSTGPVTVVGEVGLYLHRPRTATVVADRRSIVYRLSRQALADIERREPATAAALHRMMAALLAERLATSLETLRGFLD